MKEKITGAIFKVGICFVIMVVFFMEHGDSVFAAKYNSYIIYNQSQDDGYLDVTFRFDASSAASVNATIEYNPEFLKPVDIESENNIIEISEIPSGIKVDKNIRFIIINSGKCNLKILNYMYSINGQQFEGGISGIAIDTSGYYKSDVVSQYEKSQNKSEETSKIKETSNLKTAKTTKSIKRKNNIALKKFLTYKFNYDILFYSVVFIILLFVSFGAVYMIVEHLKMKKNLIYCEKYFDLYSKGLSEKQIEAQLSDSSQESKH